MVVLWGDGAGGYTHFELGVRASGGRWVLCWPLVAFHARSGNQGAAVIRSVLPVLTCVWRTRRLGCSGVGKEVRFIVEERVKALTEALFSLDEPWRGRFLDLVAKQATRWKWDGRQPEREEVTAWLGASPGLYQEMTLLLSAVPKQRLGNGA